ncbi:MAG: ABC transporter substrate-binding protein [Eubacteriales bacterium]
MKKWIQLTMAAVLAAGLTACSQTPPTQPSNSTQPSEPETSGTQSQEDTSVVRIGSLKGPTSMGLVQLMEQDEAGSSRQDYEFTMAAAADELTALFGKGELDAMAIPANVAASLYNNTQGGLKVAAINTLGVLYIVENGDTVHSLQDLSGKTLYTTGKGTTPEYALNYLLAKAGVADVTVEFKSESAEVAALLAGEEPIVAMLPQPFVTTAQMKNDKLRVALDVTEVWDELTDDSQLVTGVLVVRADFLEKNKAAVDTLLEEYEDSVDFVQDNLTQAAQLVEKYDIVPAAVAEKALPQCNITFEEGEDMKEMLSGYLQTLFDQNPKAVGGALPDENFYYDD